MATHSSVLAWRIPGTVEPGGLLSLGLHRVGGDLTMGQQNTITLDTMINVMINHNLLTGKFI